jgi:hypothetical protein
MKDSTQVGVVVRDRAKTVTTIAISGVALFVWLIAFVIAPGFFDVPVSRRGGFFVLIVVLLNTAAALKVWGYSLTIRGDMLALSQWLGLKRRKYRADDIASYQFRRVRASRLGAGGDIHLRFNDGTRILVGKSATNIDHLAEWLRHRVAVGSMSSDVF